MSVKIVIAHHPYEAQRPDEISFEKDEVIKVTDFSDPDWWVGKKKDGSLGFFPSNFVREKDDTISTPAPVVDENEDVHTEKQEEPEESKPITQDVDEKEEAEDTAQEAEQEEPIEEKKVDKVIGMARVMEDYAMSEVGEISLHRGGIINVYEIIDDEWSRGELNGKVGKYPSKYVEDIDMPTGRPDLGSSAGSNEHKATVDGEAPKGGFKLAAFGVKQGGIGSLFSAGGGFPGLKKASAPKPAISPVVSPPVASPLTVVPAAVPVAQEEKEEPAVTSPVKEQEEEVVKQEPTKEQSLGKAIVLHPYDAESEDELSLLRGEYVDILDRNADDGWWRGINERGQSGVFPYNFVREIEESVMAPPTPTRTRSAMAKPPQIPRPASVQTPATGAKEVVPQRPSSISHTDSTVSSKIFPTGIPTSAAIEEEKVEEKVESLFKVDFPAKEESSVHEKEEKHEPPVVESPTAVEELEEVMTDEENRAPVAVERKQSEPALFNELSEPAPTVIERVPSIGEETAKSPPVYHEEPISDEEEKESGVEEITSIPPVAPYRNSIVEEQEDSAIVRDKEQEEEEIFEDAETAKEIVPEPVATVDEEQAATPPPASSTEEEEQEEKKELEIPAPSGPKLTAPSRARIGAGRARRSPAATSNEPSQTELLQKEILEQKEEEPTVVEETKPSPPAKPVKPIFAKFPTPFASGDAISKVSLKPTTQTRRLWGQEENKEEEPKKEEAETIVRPSGVKNIASRFNFAGPSSGGSNEVLETKLKNHTKNEIEKLRKEFEALLNEEREKRTALENLVQELLQNK